MSPELDQAVAPEVFDELRHANHQPVDAAKEKPGEYVVAQIA